jgi:hypothetical protein
MNRIILKGRVANSFQLISLIAAQKKLSRTYSAEVFLNIRYYHYWKTKNIPQPLLDMLEACPVASGKARLFKIKINHSNKLLNLRRVVIDDGVGAYRKDPFAMLAALNRERAALGKPVWKFFGKTNFLIKFYTKQVRSLVPRNHISIFNKTPHDYFGVNQDNIPFFIEAIEDLAEYMDDKIEMSANSIIFVSNPYLLSGFASATEYRVFIKKMLSRLNEKYPEHSIFVKKHPADEFDYNSIEIDSLKKDYPAEFIFYWNQRKISAIIGFNSTSLLTGKVLFDLDSFHMIPPGRQTVTPDFWVNKAFLRHTKPFVP